MRLTILGLLLGATLGLAKISFEKAVAHFLMEMLRDEARAACACDFDTDSLTFSLFNLSGEARNARLTMDGKDQLVVPFLEAHFDPISKILEKRIAITDLTLHRAEIHQIGPDGGTFKFIDHLAIPLTPEQQKESKIRVRLLTLDVVNGLFIQDLPDGQLHGKGMSFGYRRDDHDDLILTPGAKKLTYVPTNAPEKVLSVGELKSELYVTDESLSFKHVGIALGESLVSAIGKIHTQQNNAVSANLSAHLFAKDYPIIPGLDGQLKGQATVSGSSENLEMTLSVVTPESAPLTLSYSDEAYGPYTLELESQLKPDVPFEITKLLSTFESGSFANTTPIILSSAGKQGTLHLEFKELNLPEVTLLSGDINVTLSTGEQAPTTQIAGTIGGVRYQDHLVPSFSIDLKLQEEIATLSLEHGPSDLGQARITAEVHDLYSAPHIEQMQISIKNLALLSIEKEQDFEVDNLIQLSLEGSLEGELTPDTLTGKGDVKLAAPSFVGESALTGPFELADGLLHISLSNTSKSLQLDTKFPLSEEAQTEGSVALTLSEFEPHEYNRDLSCIKTSLRADYAFPYGTPLEGTGKLSLDKLTLGCEPYQTRLHNPVKLSITDGIVDLTGVRFESTNSHITLSGSAGASLLDLKIDGDILLQSLLPLAPFMDDLSGQLFLNASISGSPEEPEISGRASLKNGSFALESGDLSGGSIVGDFILSPDTITLEGIKGQINGGRAELTGGVDLNDIENSAISFEFDQMLYQPSDDTYALLSGILNLGRSETGNTVLRGEIDVDSSEMVQEFDFRDFVARLPNMLLRSDQDSQKETDEGGTLPAIDLDVTIQAKRNSVIITSFLGAEFTGKIDIMGNLNHPLLRGQIETLRGWVGLREARFEITSGKFIFIPSASTPQIELVAETYARGRKGQNVLVLLEVDGSMANPRIRLSSDQNLSEREVFALLGTRSDFRVGSTVFGRGSSDLEISSVQRAREGQSFFGRVFHEVTEIDSISFEPQFNARRGQLEPALIVEKNLLPKLDLIGETFLSSSEGGYQLILQYQLREKVRLLGSIDTVNSEERASFGADLAFTVLSREKKIVLITIEGNEEISREELLEHIRLSTQSRVIPDALKTMGDTFRQHYVDNGFFNAQVEITCDALVRFCSTMSISIKEGEKSTLSKVSITGDPLPKIVEEQLDEVIAENVIATSKLRDSIYDEIIRSLRRDGFLQARAQVVYHSIPGMKNEKEVVIDLFTGKAVTFNFTGNTQFSETELLETINLFNRRQPFGNNTIHILARNIERLYRENGFLLATVQAEDSSSKDNRTNYNIKIIEETRVTVDSVTLDAEHPDTLNEIKEHFEQQKREDALELILDPDYAVSEQLQQNSALLREALYLIGYPEASVTFQIDPNEYKPTTIVTYHIAEGRREYAEAMRINSAPEEVTIPELPIAPYSVPKANAYITELIAALEDAGYFSSSIWTELSTQEIVLHIEPGIRDQISEVQLIGNELISDEEMERYIAISPGDPYTREAIQSARRKLLRLGLFSRVDIARTSIEPGKSRIEIALQERPQQTLDLGFGANSEFGLHLFGEGVDRSLFADGRTLSARFDTYYDDAEAEISRGIASIRYSNPNFLNRELQHSEDLSFQKLDLSTYEFDLDRVSFASFLGGTDEDFGWSFGHTVFHEDLKDVSPGAILDPDLDTGSVVLSMLSATANLDHRDNQLNPTSGYALRADTSLASDGIGSDASYYLLDVSGSYLSPFQIGRSRFGIAHRLRGASSWGIGSTDSIPITQRFYLGGRTTVRGFRENSLGPLGEDDAVIGGDLLTLLNQELRYYPTDTFSIHLFMDSGTVFLQEQSSSFADLRHGAGVGLRYGSPIGPVGFDIGHPLDERSGEPSVRFHFSIGSNF